MAMALAHPALAQEAAFDVASGDEDLRDRLRAASLLIETVEGEEPALRREIVAAAQADYRRLLGVLFAQGYFGPSISISVDGTEAAALPALGSSAPVGAVAVRIEPGPRFLFREATIAPVAAGTELPEGFAPGEPAGTAPIRAAAAAAVLGWRQQGHAKAEVTGQDIVADHPEARLDARLTVAPGPEVRFGPVFVQGNERVREGQIRRIAGLRQGDTYDPDQLEAAARRLQRTGAFRSVSITEADDLAAARTLPLTLSVAEELPRRFGAGAEFSTSDGITLTGYWLHRNLTGFADSFRVDADISGIGGSTGGTDASLSFAYNRPATFNAETDLYVAGGIESLDERDFSSDRLELEVGARRIVNEEFQYSYGLAYERSRVTDAFGTRTFSIFSLPLEAQYDRRDDSTDARDGYFVGLEARPFLGGSAAGSGLRFAADLRGYQGFGPERSTVIAARLQLGSVLGAGIDDVPPEYLFFSGGGGTVRGQPYQSLAVIHPNGRRTGGRGFAALSTEVRRDVTDAIGLVGFVDVGLVSEDPGFSDADTHVGAGLGLRYRTGIGPIRLDVGLPVSGPGPNDGVEIYIGLGQAF